MFRALCSHHQEVKILNFAEKILNVLHFKFGSPKLQGIVYDK